MGDLDSHQTLAATRSHEDSKAVNSLFQAAGQSVILINGGAATAILTFAASANATIRVTPTALASSLSLFASGVVLGACVIACQALSAQWYVVNWEGKALGSPESYINEAYRKGVHWGGVARFFFLCSVLLFLIGALVLSTSLSNIPVK